MSSPDTIDCLKHGDAKWNGEVVCGECGAVYQTSDLEQPQFWPTFCRCGVRLRPGDDPKDKYSARACCSKCYEVETGTSSPPVRGRVVQVRIYDPQGVKWVLWTEHDDDGQALLSFDALLNSMPDKPVDVFDSEQGVIAASARRIAQLEALVAVLTERVNRRASSCAGVNIFCKCKHHGSKA